uniref:Uncharacterized protein n=1 Tax=Guillardia theta TaxID=55529 RepID=A0A7S4KJK8_GUITH|mmetsp:Transcript_25994/g.85538  ORF Transcript_25994/g.85538 Transcript_25994/m.85538 type:complete len:107 (+) Transcript_25994:103-423(+)
MKGSFLLVAMAVAVHVVNAYVPLNQFEEVEIVPTVCNLLVYLFSDILLLQVVRRRQFPSLSRTQLLRAQMLCQDGMSEECKKYFEESMQKAGERYSDEGYGLGARA